MSRGRSRTKGLQAGDVIDFWRVERVEVPRSVLLKAEMKVPGKAWLEFALTPETPCRTTLECRAWFEPRGLLGEVYWWGLYPIHWLVFRGIVRGIKQQAEQGDCGSLDRRPWLDSLGTPVAVSRDKKMNIGELGNTRGNNLA